MSSATSRWSSSSRPTLPTTSGDGSTRSTQRQVPGSALSVASVAMSVVWETSPDRQAVIRDTGGATAGAAATGDSEGSADEIVGSIQVRRASGGGRSANGRFASQHTRPGPEGESGRNGDDDHDAGGHEQPDEDPRSLARRP